MTHEFTLTLSGVEELTTAVEDGLFEAGCDDATLGMCDGRAFLGFSRDGATLEDAIASAIRDVRRAGIGADVLHVDGLDYDPSLPAPSDADRRAHAIVARAINAELELARLRAADPGLVARVGRAVGTA